MKEDEIMIPEWTKQSDAIEAYKIFEADMTSNGHHYEIGQTTSVTGSYPNYYDYVARSDNDKISPIGDIAFERIGWSILFTDTPLPLNHPKNKYIIAKVKLWGIVTHEYHIPMCDRERGNWARYDRNGVQASAFECCNGKGTQNPDALEPIQYYVATNIDVVEIVDDPQQFLIDSIKDIAEKDPNFLKLIPEHSDMMAEDPTFMKIFKDKLDYSELDYGVIPPHIFTNPDTCPNIDENPVVINHIKNCIQGRVCDDKFIRFAREHLSSNDVISMQAISSALIPTSRVKALLETFHELKNATNLYPITKYFPTGCRFDPVSPIFEAFGLEKFENLWVRIPAILTAFPADKKFIEAHKDELSWKHMAQCYKYITPEFYEKYKDRLDINLLICNRDLPSHTIYQLKKTGRINSKNLVTAVSNLKYYPASEIMTNYPNLLVDDSSSSIFHTMAYLNKTITPEFINKYWYRFTPANWDRLCGDGLIDEHTAIKFAHCINWNTMSANADMSESFITSNWYRLNPAELAQNPYVFTTDLIERDAIKTEILKDPYMSVRSSLLKYGTIDAHLYRLLFNNAEKIIHNIYPIWIIVNAFGGYILVEKFENDFKDLFFWRA